MSKELRVNSDDIDLDEFAEQIGVGKGNLIGSTEQRISEKIEARKKGKQVNILGLVDATGSMSRVWETTHGQIKELLLTMGEHGDVHMKWIAYRDYASTEVLLEPSEWTNDAQKLIQFFSSINCYGGAGTWEEAVDAALNAALKEKEKTKTVFLMGDAPPHDNPNWKQAARNLAKAGMKVFSFVVVNPDVGDTWRKVIVKRFTEISRITGGACCVLRSTNDIINVLMMVIASQIGSTTLKKTITAIKGKSQGQLPENIKKFGDDMLLLGE